jgi:hypothetical protein
MTHSKPTPEPDLRAALSTLADRWEDMAGRPDLTPPLADRPHRQAWDARCRTYGRAARDLRHVLATGRIPNDLMTDAELDAATGGAR